MLAFISAADSDECQHGMRDGLAAELQEGIDCELTVRNAQGDMPTLVREQVAGKVDVGFTDAGEHTVKNIRTPVRVYRVAAAS